MFAAANFAGSIIIFYNTDLFGFALREHVGHELMNLHFLLTGYIFALTMIGADPLPARARVPDAAGDPAGHHELPRLLRRWP